MTSCDLPSIDLPSKLLPEVAGIAPELCEHMLVLLHFIDGLDGSCGQHRRDGGRETIAETGETLVVNDVTLPCTEPAHTCNCKLQGYTDNIHVLRLQGEGANITMVT